MNTKNLAVILLLTALSSATVFSQVKFVCAGKNFVIPAFRIDSIKNSFVINQFEKLKILDPIRNSKFEIELRGYYQVSTPSAGSVIIIKGNHNKLFAETYYYRFQKNNLDTLAPKGFKTTFWGKRKVYFSVKNIPLSRSILSQLIKKRLFELPDAKKLRDSLSINGIKIARTQAFDPYYMVFTLKVLNNYRSFYCDPFMAAANKDIKELIPEKLLFEQFDKIYNQSGQERNHLFP